MTMSTSAGEQASLAGTTTRVLVVEPYRVLNFAHVCKLGKFTGCDPAVKGWFDSGEIYLPEETDIRLVQFDRGVSGDAIVTWGKKNKKMPIQPAHLLGIGIQYPREQLKTPIVALGALKEGCMLCLGGHEEWRPVCQLTPGELLEGRYLFGFIY